MSSDHSSDSDGSTCKTEWLKDTIAELASYISTCEAGLTRTRLAIPEFDDKSIIEGLVNDVADFIQNCKVLQVHIELLLRFDSDNMCPNEWRAVKSRCRGVDLDIQSLEWRCENDGVPMFELA